MFNRLLPCAIGLVLYLVASAANGGLIFSEDFEAAENVVGEKPPPAIWDVVESPATARIAAFGNPGKSVYFVDNEGDLSMRHEFAPQTSLVFNYDIYLDSAQEGAHARLFGEVGDWQLVFLTSGFVATLNAIGSFDDLEFFAYQLDTWYRVTRTLDLIADTGTISVVNLSNLSDGATKLDAIPDPANTFIDTIGLGTSGSLGSDSFIDNISITNDTSSEVVPEPSNLALLGTGAIGLIVYRRRKRKSAA
jgi:hypothetical protein